MVLDACAACVIGKSMRVPHKEIRRVGKYLEQLHTYIAGAMPVVSARERRYVSVLVGDYTRAICEAGAFSDVRSR